MSERLTLGQRVAVRAKLARDCRGRNRVWTRFELPQPIEGLVMGYRNRHDGFMDSDTDDWGGGRYDFYVAKRGFKTVLVATHLDRSPLVVLPDDLSPLPVQAQLENPNVRADARGEER